MGTLRPDRFHVLRFFPDVKTVVINSCMGRPSLRLFCRGSTPNSCEGKRVRFFEENGRISFVQDGTHFEGEAEPDYGALYLKLTSTDQVDAQRPYEVVPLDQF